MFVATGDYDRALADYGKSIELDPNFVVRLCQSGAGATISAARTGSRRCIARVRSSSRRAQAALFLPGASSRSAPATSTMPARDIERAITIQGDQSAFYSLRGLTLASKGELDQAIRDYGHATQLDAQGALNYARRGLADEKEGRCRRCARRLPARTRRPRSRSARPHAGPACHRGRPATARQGGRHRQERDRGSAAAKPVPALTAAVPVRRSARARAGDDGAARRAGRG